MTDTPGPVRPCALSILVVSYNTQALTRACLEAVRTATDGLDAETIVVDNASTDGSAEMIREAFPEVRLVAHADNLGFAGGNNLAATMAAGRRLLLLNPDTALRPDALRALTRFADDHPEARIWGGRTYYADGTLNPTSCWGRQTLWSLLCNATGLSRVLKASETFNPEGIGAWRRDDARAVDIVSGCFLMIDADLWRALGGFDPRFFMYAEEADLCLRARMLGARPMITPDAGLIHHGGASERVRADKRVRLFAGKVTLMEKHWSPAARLVGRALFQAMTLTRLAGFGLAAALPGGARHRATFEEWRAIWRRRAEWARGYPAASASTDATPREI